MLGRYLYTFERWHHLYLLNYLLIVFSRGIYIELLPISSIQPFMLSFCLELSHSLLYQVFLSLRKRKILSLRVLAL